MKKRDLMRKFEFSFALLLFASILLLSTNSALAFDNSFEKIIEVLPDTGNMNEPVTANRKFAAQFKVKLGTSTAEIYKNPQNDSGTPQRIYVKAFISWRNDNNFTQAFSSSFVPISNGVVTSAKTFNFSIQSPNSWGNPARLVILARYQSNPGGAPFSFSGRGDVWNKTINMPPPSADVTLGGGSTYYEALNSFSGSIGEALPNGTVKINFNVGVSIFRNPLGGAYDPTSEGVRVWADMSGGTNPTMLIYQQAKLAGAWWSANGKPSLPFILPFNGSYVFPSDTPGVIVGGVALSWPPYPSLGSNTTWGQQNTYTWRLPPRGVNISVPTTVYESVSYTYKAQALLRSLQVSSRISGYKWLWGNNTSSNLVSAAQTTCSINKIYNTPGTYNAECVIYYKNSDSYTTTLKVPFKVVVKPLPRIFPPNQIAIRKPLTGETVLFPGEDTSCNYQAVGQTQLICQPNQTNNYSLYYRFFENPSVNSFTQSPFLAKPQETHAIAHTFTTLGQKKIELWVRYKKATILSGNLVNVPANNPDGYFHHRLQSRTVTVESQTVLEGDAEQRITFSVAKNWADNETDYVARENLTVNDQSTTISFSGSAKIFYAHRDENSNLDLDQKSGVRPGSVKYRWKILTPDNLDACVAGMAVVDKPNLLNWQTLAGTATNIAPIAVTFRVPFGTTINPDRYYRVILEGKYKELAWEPVYSTSDPSKVINWKDSLFYANNHLVREIIYNSTDVCSSPDDFRDCSVGNLEPPLNKEGTDLLYDGSMMVRVKIMDLVPARFALISVPSSATTGDPLADPEIRVQVADNNPDAILNLLEVKYHRFDQSIYGMSSELTARQPVNGASAALQHNQTESFTYETIASAKFSRTFTIDTLDQANFDSSIVAFYNNSTAHLPDSFAVTMAPPYDGKLPFTLVAHLDDGTNYYIESEQMHLAVYDNDAPELTITLVNSRDNTTRSFALTGGFNDLPAQPAQVELSSKLNDTLTYTEKVNDILPTDANQLFEFAADLVFTGIAHQRFLCNIEVTDNVKPAAPLLLDMNLEESNQNRQVTVALNKKSGDRFVGNRPEYLFYMSPNDLRRLTVKIVDGAGNQHGLNVPIKIVPPGQTEIRVLQQNNKTEAVKK